MHPPDFLHKEAATELCEHFIAAGAACSLCTNSAHVLEAARKTFPHLDHHPASVDLSLRFWIDEKDPSQPPWPAPYVRGLDHLVFASFDAGSSILADLRSRHVIGRFSPSMAADGSYWQSVIFPMLLTIVSASIGVAELHCACVSDNQNGVLLAGPSGAGKSTLALALTQIGYGFLSDDRTLCSLDNGEVRAWGLRTQLKLRSDAAHWFESLPDSHFTDTRSSNPSLWLDPERLPGLKRVSHCSPRSLIFLERLDTPEFRLIAMSSDEALNRLNEGLMAELPDASVRRSEVLQQLVAVPCWLLQYGREPQNTARQLSEHLGR
ncbi:MAG TPA: hypothetical protein VKQ11_08545 [Candidatus Sulfotelmatobacter sp.]|nr:hypothetical protein [Candidatus Sulfotelmatobacter sp.]